MTYQGIPNIACIFQVVSGKNLLPHPNTFSFFFYIFQNLKLCCKSSYMSQFWFLQYLKKFLLEYILKFAIHNQIKKLRVSEIIRNWNKQQFHFWLILETQKFLIWLCIAIMTIYSCRNVFRYCEYQI
jgi:hypothetical protein